MQVTNESMFTYDLSSINFRAMEDAINVMRRAGKVHMPSFQVGDAYANTEEEMHACGNSACFAGWIAVSQEWRAAGGHAHEGEPITSYYDSPYDALAAWLGLPDRLIEFIVVRNNSWTFWNNSWTFSVNHCSWSNWKAEHVIAILEHIKTEAIAQLQQEEYEA